MNKGNKRILIIGFFILIWSFVIYYGYLKYQSQGKNGFEIYEFSNQKITKTINTQTADAEPEIFIYNPEIDDGILDYLLENRNYGNLENTEEQDKGFFEQPDTQSCGIFPCYTSEEFLELYRQFEIDSELNYIDEFIYDGGEADMYLRTIAENRDYKSRVFAKEEDIIDYANIKTYPEVRDAYIAMRGEMKKQDILLHFVSGYRSTKSQVSIFKNRMGQIVVSNIVKGDYDEKITQVLNRSALPGYSKHHSGYAVDFGCGNAYLVYEFAGTSCYEWMSAHNFENAKRFGFIPSYPNTSVSQGPDPEPWEYVWVGIENIKN